jgi:putative Ca2+/H+ antiporter (TMEM165/GDT1 family)
MRTHASLLLLAAALAFVCCDADDVITDGSPSAGKDGFFHAFGESFAVILATEIGDRTFFIAAIMAMRHPRVVVWGGAAAALVVMTVLSTLVGHVAPLLISRQYTQYAAAGLFLFFGVRMLMDGLRISHTGASDELEEVEAELTKKEVCTRTRSQQARRAEVHSYASALANSAARVYHRRTFLTRRRLHRS